MVWGVTPEGFKAKKFDDIISDLTTALNTQLNIDIDSNPDSIAKVLTNIYSLALADEWALPQTLQSMFDVDKAEGKHLDDLVGYVGIRRLGASGSTGAIYLTADNELTVPSGSTFLDVNGNSYTNPSAINVTSSSTVDLTLLLTLTASPEDVVVVINGTEIGASLTSESDLTTLSFLINNNSNTSGVVFASVPSTGVLNIVSLDDTQNFTCTYTSNMAVETLISKGVLQRDVVGAFSVPVGTVITSPAISGITDTTNRYEFSLGREAESDIDLRVRHADSLATAGAGTVEAIRADLLGINGVTTVIVIENDTMFTDVLGIPAKSFLSVVEGGLDQDIGDELWLTKGAGISTYGDIDVVVVDSQGNDQSVSFSRPTPVYTYVNVDYTIYTEQSHLFPVDGEEAITQVVLTYGESLGVGVDIIPQRIATEVFNSIGGLATVDVTIGKSGSPNDPFPVLSPAIISVDEISKADFDLLRITVSEV